MEGLKTNWKKNNDPNYLGEWDLEGKKELVLTIDHVIGETLTLPGGAKEKKNVIYFKDDYHPMVVNSTNAKMLQKLTGSKYIEDWKNTQMAVYFDPTVKFGRETVGGLRIRAPKLDKFICADCGCEIQDEENFKANVIANMAKSKHGAYLCMRCAKARTAALEEKKSEGDVL